MVSGSQLIVHVDQYLGLPRSIRVSCPKTAARVLCRACACSINLAETPPRLQKKPENDVLTPTRTKEGRVRCPAGENGRVVARPLRWPLAQRRCNVLFEVHPRVPHSHPALRRSCSGRASLTRRVLITWRLHRRWPDGEGHAHTFPPDATESGRKLTPQTHRGRAGPGRLLTWAHLTTHSRLTSD